MTQYIKRLPAVFQTVTQKKFFDATFDQVLSKKDSDYLAGFIGQRIPGCYNPITDFYLPEPSKNRTWWQLEATAYAQDAEANKTNIFFYDDLLERIEYYGGNTLNQDRLFESEYYSFGPPIDYDMFINYHNYYWVEQGLATISITGVVAADIIGKPSFNTNDVVGATPVDLQLTTGMSVLLVDDPAYSESHTVENFGGCDGIQLVPKFSDFTAGTIFEFLPWDGTLELSTGRLIQNIFWDGTTWDTQTQPVFGDYITIERGSLNRNAWSRTNKWFHIDAINATVAQTGTSFPGNATRALRPIIQFVANLDLYKSGTQFRSDISYGFRNNIFGNPILLSDVQGQQLTTINTTYGIGLQDGDLVCFFNDTTDIPPVVNNFIYSADLQFDGSITFNPVTSYSTPVLEGDIIFAIEDAPYDGAQRGSTWYFTNGAWVKAFNDKIYVNQPPLFQLYDHNGIMLDDVTTYPDSIFVGSKIFSYKVNTTPGATTDPVLGFPIVYTSLGQASDILFQNNLITNRYTYSEVREHISGYYYYKTSTSPILYNNWNLYNICDCPNDSVVPDYQLYSATASQTVVNTILPTVSNSAGKSYLQVYVNGIYQQEGITKQYTVTGANQITFNTGLALNDDIVIKSYASVLDIPDYDSFVSAAAQTIFNTLIQTSPVSVNDSYLQVYVNGVLQQEGVSYQYTVTGANQITFNTGLALNDDVVIYGYETSAEPPHYSVFVSGSAQTSFNTTFPVSMGTVNKSYLQVYVNGALQQEGATEQFTVTGTNQITFNVGLSLNDNLVIYGNDSPIVDCPDVSKQRVIDTYVVGYGSEFKFKLSVTPYGYDTINGPYQPLADTIVSVNGTELKNEIGGFSFTEINNSVYIDITSYLTNLLLTTQAVPPVVEAQTYTHGLLDPAARGYSEIPQQLEANPSNLEVGEISASNLSQQFASIISNQIGFTGTSFGGINNYRDSRKNRSVGSYILQNVSPALKAMLVSSENDLDFIRAARFSQDEYTKFKNKYLSVALQLINQEFSPVAVFNNNVIISYWVGEIFKILNVSKEFSNAFAYSYMVASGTPFASETFSGPGNSLISLTNFIDLDNPKNVVYVYDVTNPNTETLLVVGQDYEIISTNLTIDIQLNIGIAPANIYIALYQEPLPTYVPSTPSKVGTYPVYVPRIELDTTFVNPTNVIIGHDGSKTIAYNDYRDVLLLELEKRIYNFIQYKFRNEYALPLRVESVKSGYFRQTRYTRDEYLDITQSYLNKWSTKNRANYRSNDWDTASLTTPVPDLWKLYNYRAAVTPTGAATDLPGNWKGIFQYYYDTYYPDTRPWEMLGLSEKPSWWEFEYGAPVLNGAGQDVWTSVSVGNNVLWSDLEIGMIRQGPSSIFDPVTLIPQPQEMWTRPGLSLIIPVDAAGEIIPVPTLFGLAMTPNPYEPFDGYDNEWIYGDGAPVEQAWISSSGYAYSVQEFMYLMRPGPYGEQMWDTLGTELSPGTITIPGIVGPVRSNANWQYVQNDTFTYEDDQFFEWFRPKNKDQIVHAENVDGTIAVRFGYQCWISDRILYLNNNVADTFGQKIRTLDVNLANKFAGFTNKDTTNTYIEAITPGASTNTLIIPSTNFEVVLHKSPPVNTYSYSGVIIRALEDGTFVIYGYDVLNSEFTVLDRATDKLIEVSVGGTPAEFVYFTPGATYVHGDIVRYNGVYFSSNATQTVEKFIASGWTKLPTLPVDGGISVSYKPNSKGTTTVYPYGSILKTAQDVFDVLIGWGAYLKTQGWQFDEVSQDTNLVSDWLSSAKQFLFWLNTAWAPNASIQLSPLANKATLIVGRGYPDDVESLSNGVYSILDKSGIAIAPNNTSTDREGPMISVEPNTLSAGGIYFLQINASETEHILIFDNVTSFNDTIYSPLLRARQQRLRFNGFRSNGWYGKMEAPGYLIIDNQMVPNYDTIVEAMRYYYDPDVTIDNPSLEDLGRHLIGYESKSYLDNLQISNDVQYLFYQGAIRQKGTIQAFDKLFRSTKVQSDEIIEVFEEWALKLGDFGNTVEQVSTEFRLTPEQNTGEVIVARLNFMPSEIGTIRLINVMNAQNTYTSVPRVVIPLPDATPDSAWTDYDPLQGYLVGSIVRYDNVTGAPVYYTSDSIQIAPSGAFNPLLWTVLLETRIAKAYIVLNANDRISRVDVTDQGYGYLSAPNITIDSGTDSHSLDKLYSVWQGAIIKDETLDNIVNIDIDQQDVWVVRPNDPSISLEFPVTKVIDYPMPNAGYVNFNDVDLTSFDVVQTTINWGTDTFNPVESNTVWIAKTFTEDWNVYKLVNIVGAPYMSSTWRVQEDEAGNLLLLTDYSLSVPADNVYIIPQMWNSTVGERTDFGNMIVLQQDVAGVVPQENNFTLAFLPYSTEDYANPGTYTDPDSLTTYNAYSLTTLDGIPISATEIGTYADLNKLLLFKTMRWPVAPIVPNLPTYVHLGDFIWVDNVDNKWTVIKMQGEPGIWDIAVWDSQTVGFWGSQFYNYGWDTTGPFYFAPYRVQEELINTSFFENARVYGTDTQNELVQFPVYDPFKNILPGPAKQNISYVSLLDPARYNVSADIRLLSENITFGNRQVGQLWWDTSTTKFVYYEQPIALDGSETELDNLVYRRDNWAQLFPGSTVDIYEWVKSDVPPSEYTGTGVPRSTTSYVVITTSNRFTSVTETNYYFWVLGATDKPNVINRTLAAVDVSRLLQSPKSQGFVFFSPIQQTSTNNSYMFYNAQDILAYKGDNVQIQYRISEREDQEHTQWAFFREGDSASLVTDQFWNKFVDSICAYTKVLPVSDEFTNSIIVANFLPWDIYGWDVSPYDNATSLTSPEYGEVLPVPDPMLSSGEKYGVEYRPRQSMFVKLQAARKVFVQSANALLKYIPIRDDNPGWNTGVTTSDYWRYTNWYAVGFENVVPTIVYSTLALANAALLANQLYVGQIVQVTNGTIDGRYVLYSVVQLNPNITVFSLEEVAIQNSAIMLLDTVYTAVNKYGLSTELRQLLNAFRTQVMINDFIVDQNELFFSMLNYIVSEQKNPDWLFKSSYIYVKENNLPLVQTKLYSPDNIDSVIKYLQDAKPYHTHIRDFTSTHVTSDIAVGTAFDSMMSEVILQFGPDYTGEQYVVPFNNVDSMNGPNMEDVPNQFISRNDIVPFTDPGPGNPWPDVIEVPLTFFDASKIGLSDLFPYTFNFNSLNLDNPQTFVTPNTIIAIQTAAGMLYYGQDYYVEYNNDTTYTVYFYNDPGSPDPVAFVWIDGGALLRFENYVPRNETADVVATDDFAVNVDTKLPVIEYDGILYPYASGWDYAAEEPLRSVLISEGVTTPVPWDALPFDSMDFPGATVIILDRTISFKENLTVLDGPNFYRNADVYAGSLAFDLLAPVENTYNIDVITVFVDPITHPLGTNILPEPGLIPGIIWIDGERIEYKDKQLSAPNTWELRLVRRGTMGTAATDHLAQVPEIDPMAGIFPQPPTVIKSPTVLVPNKVWVEKFNSMPLTSNIDVWNASNPLPDLTTYFGFDVIPFDDFNWDIVDCYSRIQSVHVGGLWYAHTIEANFLKEEEGKAIP
jgi:hypothetical protein